jgi:hypothetical protein
MKTIITLVLVIFLGVSAQAQNNTQELKVETIEMGILKVSSSSSSSKEVVLEKETEVARLYKYKNSRIKKALKFTTKRNKAKMA